MKVTIVGGAHTDADGEPTPNSPLVIVDDHGIHVSALEPASVATATSLAAHCAERGEGCAIIILGCPENLAPPGCAPQST